MITYKFTVRKERNNAVMLRFTANRKSSELALGISLPPQILEEAIAGAASKEYKEQVMKIKHYRNTVDDILKDLTDADVKTITASEFQKRVRSEIEELRDPCGSARKGNLIPLFEEKIASMHNVSSRGTYANPLARIKEFCMDADNPLRTDPEALMIEDINIKWLNAFNAWMEKRGLSVNTRWLYMSKFRAVINKALDEEIIIRDPFRRFKTKKEKTRKRSLCVEDLRRLFSYKGTRCQQFHIDMFKLIFMLCGINATDLYGLRSITRDGRIEYRRAKTGTLYSIKVEPEAMEIINRYKGEKNLLMLADRFKESRKYTILTDIMLKKIGKSIDDNLIAAGEKSDKEESDLSKITTYWARHTWATIARKIGISKDDIALALGHSSGHDMTEIYIEESTDPIDRANRRVLDYVLYGDSNLSLSS